MAAAIIRGTAPDPNPPLSPWPCALWLALVGPCTGFSPLALELGCMCLLKGVPESKTAEAGRWSR